MREFFKQCLDGLEAKTGLRQLYFMEQREDGKKMVGILLDSMMIVSKEFDYIPEAAQKSIIASQMIKDQEYDALNSRVIWKWLNAFKSPYLNPAQLQEKEVIFEKLTPETEQKIANYLAELKGDIGKPILKDEKVEAEMKQIEKEDRERVERISVSAKYKVDPEKIVLQKLKIQYAQECTNLSTGRVIEGKPSFEEWLQMEQ